MEITLSSFLQMKFNLCLYEKLGWKIASVYIFVLGRLYFFLNRGEQRKIREALKSVFRTQYPAVTLNSIIKKVMRGILLHYYEKLFNAFSSVDVLKAFLTLNIRAEGIDNIKNGLINGMGVLLVTGHFGGVEYLPAFLCHNNIPATIIAKFSSADLRNKSKKKAEIYGCKIIDADHSENIIKDISDNLNENRVVITQCDEIEEWRPSRRNRVSFLGRITGLDRTIDILVKRCRVPVVFGVMHRSTFKQYRLDIFSLDEMKKRVHTSERMPLGEIILKTLEQFVCKHPEEWYQWKNVCHIESFQNNTNNTEVQARGVPITQPA